MKECPPFRLDTVDQYLWRHTGAASEERMLLTPIAFAILRYLVEHAGRLVTHDELLDAVWPDAHVQPQAVKRHILDVRSALGDDPKNPVFIETLPRRGYQFIAAVSEGRSAVARVPARPGQGRLPGRERALGDLRESLWRASNGQRQIVFVTGEPGIGKTALVDEFERQTSVGALSIRIARGQCIEGCGGKEAYYPILQALGALCGHSGGDYIVQTPGRAGADVVRFSFPHW